MAGLCWQPARAPHVVASLARAEIVLIGEFHPLPGACETACSLLESASAAGSAVWAGLELAHARDQAALDAYLSGRIGARELRRRMRYADEWGYPWTGPGALFELARETGVKVFGLDLPPRGGVDELGLRDACVAERVRALLARGQARGVLVFGEAHLASEHLPEELERVGVERPVRVFHDLEEGPERPGWYQAGPGLFLRQTQQRGERDRALARVYRRWAGESLAAGAAMIPSTIDGLIDTQARAVGLDPRRECIAPGRFLADLKPEYFASDEPSRIRRRLAELGVSRDESAGALARAFARGAELVPGTPVLIVASPGLRPLAWETGTFLVRALRHETGAAALPAYVERALGFVLARLLDPELPAEDAAAPGGGAALGGRLHGALERGELSFTELRAWLREPRVTPELLARVGAARSPSDRKKGRIPKNPPLE